MAQANENQQAAKITLVNAPNFIAFKKNKENGK
jgi:hypothetical protein